MEITVAGSVCECVSVVLFQQVGCLCATELSLTLVLIQQTLPRGCSKFMRMCPRAKKKEKEKEKHHVWQRARLSIGYDQLNMTWKPVRDIMPQTQCNTKGQV